ncbi:MAG: helix-turn-helix transcriptional regulator [Candidatus Omnitrophica bacterium]|nr:helix-turn-helix transcriptional regulator [Candidatus Omnitrophota bacterium]
MKLEKVDEHLKEKLKDPYFKELYELEMQKLKIAKRIVGYRVKEGINQAQLAKLTGVTQQHISKIERGEFSSVATLEKILFRVGYTVKIRAIPLRRNLHTHSVG